MGRGSQQDWANVLNAVGGLAEGGVGTYLTMKQAEERKALLEKTEARRGEEAEEARKNNAIMRQYMQSMIPGGGRPGMGGPPTGTFVPGTRSLGGPAMNPQLRQLEDPTPQFGSFGLNMPGGSPWSAPLFAGRKPPRR